jgi:altronate dehydratase
MKAVLVISERDNVATALQGLDAGQTLSLGATTVAVVEPVPSGHKVAIRPIAQGQEVIKYGSPIGLATSAIAAGAHVHTHNVASTRGRGDLGSPEAAAEPRLAEPPDPRNGGLP